MEILQLTATINKSGYLHLNVPTQLLAGEVSVVVVLNPVSADEKQPSYDLISLI